MGTERKAPGEKTYLGHRKRLRRKFSGTGLGGFHDYETLEFLLTFVIPRCDVKPRAKALIKKFGGLSAVLDAPASELRAMPGVGTRSSALMGLVGALAKVLLSERADIGPALNAPADVARFIRPRIGSGEGEFLYALYLDSKNRPIGLETIFEGRPDSASLPRRRIMEMAIEHNARSIIFVHTLPALSAAEGAPARPLAMALRSLASSLDILVHDYIIFAKDEVLSASEQGWFKA